MKLVAREMDEEGTMTSQAAFSEAQMKAITRVVESLLDKALKKAKKDSHREGAITNRPSGSQAGSTPQGEVCVLERKGGGSGAVGEQDRRKGLVGVQNPKR